ncbi:hypothetical protein ACFQX7_00035 [Luedemannella flava]
MPDYVAAVGRSGSDRPGPGDPSSPPSRPPSSGTAHRLRRARRCAARAVQRRRRASRWAALALTVVAVLAVAPWQGVAAALTTADQPDRPSLPAEFADLSGSSHATDRPGGRAIALYEFGSSELFTTWQTLVAGADRTPTDAWTCPTTRPRPSACPRTAGP